MYLGDFVLRRDDLERAYELFEESSELFREVGNATTLPYPLRRLGLIARRRGDFPRAIGLTLEGLALNRAGGERQGIAASLVALAQVADDRAEPVAAAQLLGLAVAQAATIGGQLLPFDMEQLELTTAKVRAQLDAATWARAWAEGHGLSLDEVVEAAREPALG
jgi:hypothetical protein